MAKPPLRGIGLVIDAACPSRSSGCTSPEPAHAAEAPAFVEAEHLVELVETQVWSVSVPFPTADPRDLLGLGEMTLSLCRS